ncbi:hypothetical protein DEU56DRAFT_756884 [Suillus clintonianus]|uniref:uncharacterized protein n=1 Tax=Suillus clintonianus TaxID=1904413 RepID=UPI001B86D7E2|nr:uncharacterized protein DEU56DRAFT_756884 [Suillus clintonianus]KAG2134861.1 hypothetical protein DEU56DRAFT_756884 [Suillus clintonianus]
MSVTIEGFLTNVKYKNVVLTWSDNDIVVAAPRKEDPLPLQTWKVVVGANNKLEGPIRNVGSNFYIGWGAHYDDVIGNVTNDSYQWQLAGSDPLYGSLHFQIKNDTKTYTLVATSDKAVGLDASTTGIVPEEGKWVLSKPT